MQDDTKPDGNQVTGHISNREWSALLDAARTGDAESIGEACERLRDYLLLVADRGVGQDLKAKLGASDIVQHSMLEATRDIGRFSGTTEREFRGWIERILQHNLIDTARSFRENQGRDISREDSARKDNSGEMVGHHETPSVCARRVETDQELARAVQSLPETKRRVIEMRHRDGLSHVQIAQQLGMTEVAARKTWSRAVEDLRRTLRSD